MRWKENTLKVSSQLVNIILFVIPKVPLAFTYVCDREL